MIADDTRLALADDVSFQSVGDGQDTVVLSLSTGFLYTCNDTTARFLALLDGRRSFAEIIAAMLAEFDVSPEKLRADMTDLTELLMRENLVVVREPA